MISLRVKSAVTETQEEVRASPQLPVLVTQRCPENPRAEGRRLRPGALLWPESWPPLRPGLAWCPQVPPSVSFWSGAPLARPLRDCTGQRLSVPTDSRWSPSSHWAARPVSEQKVGAHSKDATNKTTCGPRVGGERSAVPSCELCVAAVCGAELTGPQVLPGPH